MLPSLGELGNVPFVRRRKNNIKKIKKVDMQATGQESKKIKNTKAQGCLGVC